MRQAEDRVWNTIVECAKYRIDYDAFRFALSPSGDERIGEYLLFQMIEGFAEELSVGELVDKLAADAQVFGLSFEDGVLSALLEGQAVALAAEVAAAQVALEGLASAASVSSVLRRVRVALQLEDEDECDEVGATSEFDAFCSCKVR